jgi:hypothetical protein
MPQRVEGSIEIEGPVEALYGYWELGGWRRDPLGRPTYARRG